MAHFFVSVCGSKIRNRVAHFFIDIHTFVNLNTIDINRVEIVADVTAAVLCQLKGICGYQAQTYEYVSKYCRDKAPKTVLAAVMGALADIEQVVNKIIEVAQQSQSGND